VRFPDSTGNPYLSFAAMMMAGLDGIQNKIHPGDAMDKDLYDLPPEEEKAIPTGLLRASTMALDALDADRELPDRRRRLHRRRHRRLHRTRSLKMEEVTQLRMTTHPVEFDMYYFIEGALRGPHDLVVQRTTTRGKTIALSEPVRVYVLRPSIR
jgi:glutamine synthetase